MSGSVYYTNSYCPPWWMRCTTHPFCLRLSMQPRMRSCSNTSYSSRRVCRLHYRNPFHKCHTVSTPTLLFDKVISMILLKRVCHRVLRCKLDYTVYSCQRSQPRHSPRYCPSHRLFQHSSLTCSFDVCLVIWPETSWKWAKSCPRWQYLPRTMYTTSAKDHMELNRTKVDDFITRSRCLIVTPHHLPLAEAHKPTWMYQVNT